MKFSRFVPCTLLLLLGLLLFACQPAASAPALTATPTLTIVPSATAAPLPTATSTPLPVLTVTPENDGWCSPGVDLPLGFLVIGYLPEYRQLQPVWGNCLTDLIFFSLEPLPDGQLDTHRLKPEVLTALLALKEQHGTRLHLSLGGFGRSENFAPMVTDAKIRQAFVKNLKAFCLQNHFDGVDFDWEFPSGVAETSSYFALIKETRAALNPLGMLVSVALYPFPDLNVAPYNVADRIQIMSYDRGVRHATLEQAAKDVDYFVGGGIPREKIILGLPFYGRTMSGPSNSLAYFEIVEQYFPLPETNEVENLYFNGRNLIQQKTCYAREAGLGGVMVWELGQDSLSSFSLLRALSHGAKDGCADLTP